MPYLGHWQNYLMLAVVAELSVTFSKSEKRLYTPRLRVVQGWDDNDNKYPFVVSLISEFPTEVKDMPFLRLRTCTGSLITAQFVLTAIHCFDPRVRFVRCGNMTLPWDKTTCLSKILKQIPHSGFLRTPLVQSNNDIGLMLIEELSIKTYGKLHTADYKTLIGRAARYAGYGKVTGSNYRILDVDELFQLQNKTLQIGEGVIFNDNDKRLSQSILLVAPKCSKKHQHAYSGDSGGPLFVDGKIVAIACDIPISIVDNIQRQTPYVGFTPVSPYLNWIKSVIDKA